MKNTRRAHPLRASIVITLGGIAACRGTSNVDPPRHPPTTDQAVTPPPPPQPANLSPAGIMRANDGRCLYRQPMGGCPPGVACNPPPMLSIDCPDAGVTPPPEHPGWLRVRAGFYAPPSSPLCFFTPERWCPPAGSVEQCEASHDLSFPCAPQGSEVTVESFTYEAAPGRCARIPTFRCSTQVGACNVPASEPAPCDANTRR